MAAPRDRERWIWTKEELLNTPSARAGIDHEKELSYRQQAANLIQDMGQKLRVSQLVINTAILYMHRFYMFHSFSKFPRNNVSTCCLFLACKLEEQPRKLDHTVQVALACILRDESKSIDPQSETFQDMAQEVIYNENILLQTLGFNVTVDHPHTAIVKTCQMIRANKELAQAAYMLGTNSLHLTLFCLQYHPTVVACVCIFMVTKWGDWEIPKCSEGKDWWHYIDKSVSLESLEALSLEFTNILSKYPNRLQNFTHLNPTFKNLPSMQAQGDSAHKSNSRHPNYAAMAKDTLKLGSSLASDHHRPRSAAGMTSAASSSSATSTQRTAASEVGSAARIKSGPSSPVVARSAALQQLKLTRTATAPDVTKILASHSAASLSPLPSLGPSRPPTEGAPAGHKERHHLVTTLTSTSTISSILTSPSAMRASSVTKQESSAASAGLSVSVRTPPASSAAPRTSPDFRSATALGHLGRPGVVGVAVKPEPGVAGLTGHPQDTAGLTGVAGHQQDTGATGRRVGDVSGVTVKQESGVSVKQEPGLTGRAGAGPIGVPSAHPESVLGGTKVKQEAPWSATTEPKPGSKPRAEPSGAVPRRGNSTADLIRETEKQMTFTLGGAAARPSASTSSVHLPPPASTADLIRIEAQRLEQQERREREKQKSMNGHPNGRSSATPSSQGHGSKVNTSQGHAAPPPGGHKRQRAASGGGTSASRGLPQSADPAAKRHRPDNSTKPAPLHDHLASTSRGGESLLLPADGGGQQATPKLKIKLGGVAPAVGGNGSSSTPGSPPPPIIPPPPAGLLPPPLSADPAAESRRRNKKSKKHKHKHKHEKGGGSSHSVAGGTSTGSSSSSSSHRKKHKKDKRHGRQSSADTSPPPPHPPPPPPTGGSAPPPQISVEAALSQVNYLMTQLQQESKSATSTPSPGGGRGGGGATGSGLKMKLKVLPPAPPPPPPPSSNSGGGGHV